MMDCMFEEFKVLAKESKDTACAVWDEGLEAIGCNGKSDGNVCHILRRPKNFACQNWVRYDKK